MTVFFGIVGAGIGAGFGPGGAAWGWSIGTTIGGFIDMSNQSSHVEQGKLTDLRYSGSNYGAEVSRIWGKSMCAGNIVWVANYAGGSLVASGTANSTHLVEHSDTTSSGGGSGGPSMSSTSYWYSASYAVVFCEGTILKDDGNFVSRSHVIKKIWADDIKIYDVDDSSVKAKATLRFYSGSETQTADSLIVSAEGATKSPAYRGLVYAVIQDHDLRDFGNRIPNIKAEIWTSSVTVQNIAEDLCGQVNLYGSKIDFSLATAGVTGFINSSKTSVQPILEQLTSSFNLDPVEVDGKLKLIPRGGSSAATLTSADIGAIDEGGAIDYLLQRTIGVRNEVPGKVELTYVDINKNFLQVVQSAIKQSADFANPSAVTVNLTMTANEASELASRLLDAAFTELDPVVFNLGHKYRWLCPSDPVTISITTNGNVLSRRFRITRVDETPFATVSVSALPEDLMSQYQIITGDSGSGGGTTRSSTPVPCTFYAWSGQEILEEHKSSAGFYVAATWALGGSGGNVYYSTDGGVTWVAGPYISGRSIFGVASSVLGDGAGYNTWDYANTVDISITNDGVSVLSTVSQNEVLNGSNFAKLGSEFIGIAKVTPTGAYTYTLGG